MPHIDITVYKHERISYNLLVSTSRHTNLFKYLKIVILVVFVIGFAGFGIASLSNSRAATPYASLTAATGSLTGNASMQSDSALNAQYVLFGSSPISLAACSTSNATGAGSPSAVFTVGSPVSGDNSSQIQAKIAQASAAGGGIVQLEAGTYLIDQTLNLASNVELSGVGTTQTIIKAATTNISLVSAQNTSNVTLNNFTADASGNTLADSNATLDYTINIINSSNVIVQNIATINPFSYSIVSNNSSNFCIRDNSVQVDTSNKYNQLDGIHIEGGTKGDVLDNYVDNRYNNALDGDDGLVAQGYHSNESYVTYAGNIVRGGNNGDCMQFALGPGNISNIVVKDNEFWGCPFGIRTGGYASSGAISNVTLDDNYIHNLVPGTGPYGSFPNGGNAVDLGGFLGTGQSSYNNTVSNTYICSAGSVVPESGTTITNTTTVSGCTDAPSTTTPPPTMP